ncbi:DUF4435 domain-containing protein [Variovorax sp. 278MFTsu5.1]|uniref:DUF4435 domain-containing protein n=1 Tax=Variovorax sp. 278MFTsu5.1 TaxID=3158366 RepID=UPI003AAE96D3
MSESPNQDAFFERIKKAKEVRAVRKVEFAAFASAIPEHKKIFAFEGTDDRLVYHYWIKRLRPDLEYEAYQCNGKRKVLQLFDSLKSDLTGLKNRVWYFIDRDFDELQGRSADKKIFLTDRYSIENYIVCDKVLDDLLNVEFHCNGHPGHRQKIVQEFLRVYDLFLESTKELNFRIYAARNLNIKTSDLPETIHLLVNVSLNDATVIDVPLTNVVILDREPTPEEITILRKQFDQLNARHRYRGKFAMLFFIKWLGLLRSDRLTDPSTMFANIPHPENAVGGGFSLSALAPKSRAPNHLGPFLASV